MTEQTKNGGAMEDTYSIKLENETLDLRSVIISYDHNDEPYYIIYNVYLTTEGMEESYIGDCIVFLSETPILTHIRRVLFIPNDNISPGKALEYWAILNDFLSLEVDKDGEEEEV